MKKQLVSFVIPCYRSVETIGSVVDEIEAAMGELERYEYEIILVNDCSPDDTFGKIRELCGKDKRIKGINLARNFGQHAALMAGFHQVKGDILVCLDDDGQTPANEVGKLLAALENGADVAYAKYEHKHHSAFRNFGSRVNDWMLCFMLNKPKDLFISSYFAARRFVLEEMLKYENAFPYVIGLVLRATRNIVNVTVEHRDRMVGESGYTFGKLLALWFNGFTAFSEKPLRIATMAGVGCAGLGFLYGIYTIIKKLVLPGVPVGFSALMASIMFIGGMLMLMLGLTASECLEVISVGQWILTAGGVLLGIPMTFWMSHAFAVSMSAKMFSIPDFADAASVAESAVLMFIAVFISSRLILRKLKAVSPVSLLMERE